jgi:hypothetical protein
MSRPANPQYTENELRQRAINWAFVQLGKRDSSLPEGFNTKFEIVKLILRSGVGSVSRKEEEQAQVDTALDRLHRMKQAS